jgi:hypothetical protein
VSAQATTWSSVERPHDNITATGGRNVLIGDNARILFDNNGNLVDVTTKSPAVGGDDVITSGTGNDVIFGGSAATRSPTLADATSLSATMAMRHSTQHVSFARSKVSIPTLAAVTTSQQAAVTT